MNKERSFLKIGLVYVIGQLLSKAISFIMLPIYTRELGAMEFGKLSLADTVMDFISVFLIVTIFSGYTRFYRDYKKEDRGRLRNTAITFAIFLLVIDILFFLIFGKIIASKVLNFDNSYYMFFLIFLRGIISQFISLLICDYTLKYEAKKIVIVNLVMLVLNITFVIILVVVKRQGIFGVYKGYIYGSAIILVYLIIKNIKTFKLELDKSMLKKMVVFSGGLIPSGISGTILNLADRYFLTSYEGFVQTGIYSIGYKIGMLINPIFIAPFTSIFVPYKFQIYKSKESHEKINKMFKIYNIVGVFIVLAITLYSKFFIYIFATSEYMAAYNIISLILFSYFLYGKAEFYTIGMQIANKTYLDAIVMGIGGVINIILNIILIPKIGMYGAAISTLFSYGIMNSLYNYISQKMYSIKFNNFISIKVYFIYGFIFLLYKILSFINKNLIIEFIVNIFLLAMYIFICIKLKLISYEILLHYINRVKNKLFKCN
ncbi:lipopolysaccharide biosynthesis protein [Clostridium fallax]|uniref:Membrane protein involved in the export of O-antigen and teichoic acid n=1 Tax=Clostridium fallax TaxID=1533 RepID=A0A1M4ZD91_9CLOT|nr:oligosaccharide flippase family protein [Clostridium fallax]SHF15752.1 Membrane protein involved in the export of O-antigen and teichoic acid [Clostridium fallax]SQB06289.1 polysaccharide transporter protein [Clostridium fallax]